MAWHHLGNESATSLSHKPSSLTITIHTVTSLTPQAAPDDRGRDSLDVVKATGVGLQGGGVADHLVQGDHEEHQVKLEDGGGEGRTRLAL